MRPRLKYVLPLALCLAATAFAQRGSSNDLRTLFGHVLGTDSKPLNKAVVYLKNTRTLAIKTYITEPDGSYRFSALSPSVDYEVYADYQGARSDTRTLSAFDNRKQVDFTLKLKK